MQILLTNNSMIPIYEQLTDQIKNKILKGELAEGECLPSVRAFSAELRISALTVKKAYDILEEEGFVQTVHGKGTFVTAADVMLASEARKKSVEAEFSKAIDKARAIGMSDGEIKEVISIMLEEK